MGDGCYAGLEPCLGRALAHCGSHRGRQTTLEYLLDIRGTRSRRAYDALVALTGPDLGYGARAWRASPQSATIVPEPDHHAPPVARGP